MNRTEYLDRLEDELRRGKVADAGDIVREYEQHFAFKMADGFSEEEVAAKLGSPAGIAQQFILSGAGDGAGRRGGKAAAAVGLCLADLFAGCFFVLLFAWGIVTAAFSLCCAACAVCLLGGFNIYGLIPSMPYWCGAVFGLSLAALAVLSAVGCVYFTAFLRQLLRCYGRFHRNAFAVASGEPSLPPLAIHPRFSAKAARRLRTLALISLALFAACAVLGYAVSALSAGAIEFWHAWGWFGYPIS